MADPQPPLLRGVEVRRAERAAARRHAGPAPSPEAREPGPC